MNEIIEKYGDGGTCQYPDDTALGEDMIRFGEMMAAFQEMDGLLADWPGYPIGMYDADIALLNQISEIGGVTESVLAQYTYVGPHFRNHYGFVNESGHGFTYTCMYKIRDNAGKIYYTYCGQKRNNVEGLGPNTPHLGATYSNMDEKISAKIRSVVANGYNEALKENSRVWKNFPNLTRAEAHAATQAAVWHYTDGFNLADTNQIGWSEISSTTADILESPDKGNYKKNILSAYKWLIEQADKSSGTNVSVANPSLTVTANATPEVYNNSIRYKVTAKVKAENANGIKITVSCSGAESKSFTPTSRSADETLTFYTSSPSGTVTAKTKKVDVPKSSSTGKILYIHSNNSQDMVGYFVDANLITENKSFEDSGTYGVGTYDVTINKTGDNWTPNTGSSPLAGAKFEIDITKDSSTISKWKEVTSAENGEVKFTGIPNGFSYTIRETAAPELYHPSTGSLTGSSTKTHDVNNSLDSHRRTDQIACG